MLYPRIIHNPDMRQIVLDTETTGLEVGHGHRIIEIGCVEIMNRRLSGNNYHQYLQPDREIDEGAAEVHGISNQFLADKPRFADIASDLLTYLEGAELIIHNAPFDVGFLNEEFRMVYDSQFELADKCQILDTLAMARRMHPGVRNGLDALCKRYDIDNSSRDLHGALLDSEILADVYLAMTGGQSSLSLDTDEDTGQIQQQAVVDRLSTNRASLPVIPPTAAETEAHARYLDMIEKQSGYCVWHRHENENLN